VNQPTARRGRTVADRVAEERTSSSSDRGRRKTVAERVAEAEGAADQGDRPGRDERAGASRRGRTTPRDITGEKAGSRAGSKAGSRAGSRAGSKAARRRAARKASRLHDRKYVLRRRLGLAGAVLVVLALLAGGLWAALVFSGIARVESVQVSGALAVSQDQIVQAAAVETGVPLATLDTQAVARRVAEIPGVGSVSVGRGWPHTVEITVTERTPVALARSPLGLMLVDGSGVAYTRAPAVPPVLPTFGFGAVGPDDPATKAALTVLDALPENLRGQVTTVDVDSGPEPSVRFALGDKHVFFGTPDRAADKVAVLVPLLTEPGSTYDVASPELPTITR
jgi:cell division protein FtsQ